MKKIMFNDRYGLTKAVLEGRKTQTRRIVPNHIVEEYEQMFDPTMVDAARYEYGEIVAVAQRYCAIAEELENCKNATCLEHYEKNVERAAYYICFIQHPGYRNKMFVSPYEMPHQIRITDIRVERLQEISDDDCLKEGIEFDHNSQSYYVDYDKRSGHKTWIGSTPREAFASLIDKVSGSGTWDKNPYVFVYQFELVK